MKKLLSFLLASALCVVCAVPAFAAEAVPQQQNGETVISVSEKDLGNGFTMETVVSIPKSISKIHVDSITKTRTASTTNTIKHDGTFVGSITLIANFGYNGSSSWVNSMRTGHSIASGWSYENENTWESGGTANMSAAMIKKLAFITITEVDPSISTTCSPTGQIS